MNQINKGCQLNYAQVVKNLEVNLDQALKELAIAVDKDHLPWAIGFKYVVLLEKATVCVKAYKTLKEYKYGN